MTTTRADVITGLARLSEQLATNPQLTVPFEFTSEVDVFVHDDPAFLAWHTLLGQPSVVERGSTPFTHEFRGELGGLPFRVYVHTAKVGRTAVVGMVEQVAWTPPITDEQAAAAVNLEHAQAVAL